MFTPKQMQIPAEFDVRQRDDIIFSLLRVLACLHPSRWKSQQNLT
jgi:hypothetical protein